MSTTKQSIARFIDEYESYLSSIKKSIARVELERKQWQKERDELEENWAGAPVIAALVASHPQDAWWKALAQADIKELRATHTNAEKKIQELVDTQQFAKDKIQECTRLSRELSEREASTRSIVDSTQKTKDAAKAVADNAANLRNSYLDNRLDAQIQKWQQQPVVARSPLVYDYSKSQPWWAKPWLLAVINPEMGRNMAYAKDYERESGKNLYEALQGYAKRKDVHDHTKAELDEAIASANAIKKTHESILQAQQNNNAELTRNTGWVLPDSGPRSLVSQSEHIRATAVEYAARYCITNNIPQVGSLALELPDAQVYAQQTGKMAAMKEVDQTLAKATANWRKGEKAVQDGLNNLNKLARKHTRSTKITLDSSGVLAATRNMEEVSIGMQKRFSAARPAMQQSTPFAANSFSGSNSTTHYHTTTNTSDSNFWTMAWMYMLLSDNSHAHASHGNTETPTLLDPQKFETDYQNANGGLGLAGDFSNLNFSMGDSDVSLERDRSFAASTDGGFNIDVPAMEVESSGGSSWGSSSSSGSSSWGSSSSDSSSSWSSSSYSSSSDSSSSGSSCGSSCGGGGGD